MWLSRAALGSVPFQELLPAQIQDSAGAVEGFGLNEERILEASEVVLRLWDRQIITVGALDLI